MIYLIVGQSGSGKTSVREHLERKGFRGFESSDYVRKAMGRYSIRTIDKLLEKQGGDIVARLIHEELSKSREDVQRTAISGFRVPDEVDYFKERFDTMIIGLYNSSLTSFRRVTSGKRLARSDDPENFERFFREKICADNLLGLSKIMRSHVDHFLVNEGTLDELFEKVDKVVGLKCNFQI